MLIRLCKEGYPIDEIIFADCGDWEFQQMRDHIDRVEKLIRRPITRLLIEPSLDWHMFEYIPSNPKNRMRVWEKKGVRGLGWPTPRVRWCNKTKIRSMNRYATAEFQYVGINAEERYRLGRWQERGTIRLYPLVYWNMSGQECLNYCKSFGLDWSGLYEHFGNTSCFCCPLKRLEALRNLWRFYPELWRRLLEMESRVWNTFKPNGVTVKALQERFEKEKVGTWNYPKSRRGFNTKESRGIKTAAICRMTAQSLLQYNPRPPGCGRIRPAANFGGGNFISQDSVRGAGIPEKMI
jgi:hypothetical protein